jgi:hypothetical protein
MALDILISDALRLVLLGKLEQKGFVNASVS